MKTLIFIISLAVGIAVGAVIATKVPEVSEFVSNLIFNWFKF